MNNVESSTPPQAYRQIALAYECFLTPLGFADYDLALGFGAFDSDRETAWNTSFHARIPAKQLTGPQSDVSGNLGVIFPVSDGETKARASASERLIADAIIWQLAGLKFDSRPTLVLLQGPFLPKLRGRLLYRGTSPSLAVWSLTHQPQWFRRMEAAEQIARRIDPESGISPIYPPRGIDSSTRCWVCRPSSKTLWHLEVLANGWDCSSNPDWETDRREEIELLMSQVSDNPAENDRLPISLQTARQLAIEACEIEKEFASYLPQLRQLDHDPSKADPKTAVSVYSNILLDAQPVSDGRLILLQESAHFDFRDEQEIYKRFKSRYPRIKAAKSHLLAE